MRTRWQVATRSGICSWLLVVTLAPGAAHPDEPAKIQGRPAAIKAAVAGGQFHYVAATVDIVRRTGQVSAAGITWLCQDRRCTVSGPWPSPGVAACQALAAEVGTLRSYGHSTRILTPAELEQCNGRQGPRAPKGPLPAGPAPTPARRPSPAGGGGEPATPTPVPGGRGPGDDPDVIRDAIRRLRDEMASCQPEDQPTVSLAASLRPEETLATDRVTLSWSVSRSDGAAWASRVFLGRADDAVAAYSEVGNSGTWTLAGADLSPTRTVQWVIYTRCGEARADVGRIPSPRISAIPAIVNCDRRVPAPTMEHPCQPLTIQGSGFGSSSMPLRRVELVAGDRVVDDLEIRSWTDREIILRTPADLPLGSYTVVVSRGFAEGRFETARTGATVLVQWREILAKSLLQGALQGIFLGSAMVIDTLGERHCELAWIPRARDLTLEEQRTQTAYCSATPDPVACVQVTACSIYSPGGSYLSLALPDGPRRMTLAIPMRSISVPLLGTGRYFVDDLGTAPRGMRVNFERGPDARLNITLGFESDGMELRGFGDSAGADDDLWPDGDMDGAELVLPTHLAVSDGTLTVIADDRGVQFSTDVDLGGICSGPVDLCDLLGGYKAAIQGAVASTVPAQFNAPDTQRELQGALRAEMCRLGIGGIGRLESDTNDLFLYPTDVVGCPAP